MDSNDLIQESPPKGGNADLESLLEEGYGFTPLKRGEVREGVIVRVSPSEILIDLSGKTEGVVSGRELERMPKEMLTSLNVGDEVLAYVVNPEDKNGNIVLSLTRAQLEKDWRKAERLYEAQDMFTGQVAGFNKGGLIVRLGRVRGFVPASQLDSSRHPRITEGNLPPEERWGHLTGEELQLKVIEIDRERNRLILSERAAMREWRKMQKEKLLEELTEGEIREGRVISLADFGAFVDLGGADGLIHLSELSWKRVNHPREVLNVGEMVKVYVLNVDRDRRRIGLSLKRLQPDPWTLVDDKYNVDQLVEGVITKLAKFGAFACIVDDEEIEGLIHISELSEDHIAHPKEVVKEDQVVTLRIIRIDSDQRRMGLSLKRVDQAEYADLDWQAELVASREETEETDSEVEAGDEAETEAGSTVLGASETPQAEAVADGTVSSDPEHEEVSSEEAPAEETNDAEAEASLTLEQEEVSSEEAPAEEMSEPEEEALAEASLTPEQEEVSSEEESAEEMSDAEEESVAEATVEVVAE
jgi:small subunit ribosomal protein S1